MEKLSGAEYGGLWNAWLVFAFYYSGTAPFDATVLCRIVTLSVGALVIVFLVIKTSHPAVRQVDLIAVVGFVFYIAGTITSALFFGMAAVSLALAVLAAVAQGIGLALYFYTYAFILGTKEPAGIPSFIIKGFISCIALYAIGIAVSSIPNALSIFLLIMITQVFGSFMLELKSVSLRERSRVDPAAGKGTIFFGYAPKKMAIAALSFGILAESGYGTISHDSSIAGTAAAAPIAIVALLLLFRNAEAASISKSLRLGQCGMLCAAIGIFLFSSAGGDSLEILSFTCLIVGLVLFMSHCLISNSIVLRYQSVSDVHTRYCFAIAFVLVGMSVGYAYVFASAYFGFALALVSPILAAALLIVSEFLFNQQSLFPSQVTKAPGLEEMVVACLEICDEYDLTERQREIFLLEVEGLGNAQIAEKLFVSPNTVRYHQHQIFQKLEVNSASSALGLVREKAAKEKDL